MRNSTLKWIAFLNCFQLILTSFFSIHVLLLDDYRILDGRIYEDPFRVAFRVALVFLGVRVIFLKIKMMRSPHMHGHDAHSDLVGAKD